MLNPPSSLKVAFPSGILRVFFCVLTMLIWGSGVAVAQTYTISGSNGTTVTATTGTFYDSGGAAGAYSNNESYAVTFYSGSTAQIRLTFTSFATEQDYDFLTIYDGSSAKTTQLGSWHGATSPGTVTGSGSYLTVIFTSDVDITAAGWAATISTVAASTTDFGDYQGFASASQLASANVYIGTNATDTEAANPTSGDAGTDNKTGTNDEDLTMPSFVVGTATNLVFRVNIAGAVTAARVNVWVDWNGDGVVTGTNETQTVQSITASGNRTFALTPPTGTTAGTKYLRIRVVSGSTAPAFSGASAVDGEVEDYPITVSTSAVDPNCYNVLLANYGGYVNKYDQNGTYTTVIGTGSLTNPSELASGPDGMIYVSNESIARIDRINPYTNAFIANFIPAASNGLSLPAAMRVRPDGFLYISEYTGDKIMKFNAGSGAFNSSFAAGGVVGITEDANDKLIVFSEDANRIYRYSTTGTQEATITTLPAWTDVQSLVVDAGGNYYYCDEAARTVIKVTPAGVRSTFITLAAGSTPYSLAIAPDGSFWIGDVGHYEVEVYSSTGTFIRQFNTNINNPCGIVVVPCAASDFGDLKLPYPSLIAHNGPRHIVGASPLKMGTNIDTDGDGLPSVSANGDDTDSDGDDEDGVTIPALTVGATATVVVNSSGAAKMNAFFDWNNDGDFLDASEVITELTVAAGNNNLSVAVPAGAVTGTALGARFRLSTAGGLTSVGGAADGEVEDYMVTVNAAAAANADFGDYSVFAVATQTANSAIRIGSAATDVEVSSPANATSTGDDTVGTDDEDLKMPVFIVGTATTLGVPMAVTAASLSGSTARVNVFVDWNGDGLVTGTNETLTAQTVSASGTFNFSLTPPSGTTPGVKYLRIRAAEGATHPGFSGLSTLKGEVEDYAIVVVASDPCNCPGNLLANPSFETSDFTGWTLSTNDAGQTSFAGGFEWAVCGSRYAYFNPTAGNATDYVSYHQGVTASAGQTFTLVAYAGVHDNSKDHQLRLQFYNSSNTLLSGGQTVQVDHVSTHTSLQRYTLTGTAPAGTATARVTAYVSGAWSGLSISFKLDAVCLTSTGGTPLDYGDFGTFASASQVVSADLRMGANATDAEATNPTTTTATADDTTGTDDEDLVLPNFYLGDTSTSISIPVTGTFAGFTDNVVYLNAFIDWNGDGDVLDTGENGWGDGLWTSSNAVFNGIAPPVGTVAGTKYARIRMSEGNAVPSFSGASALRGEVEDYAVTLVAVGTLSIGNFVWLDTNENGIKDGAEAGINGVTMELLRDFNNDGVISGVELNPVRTTTTASGTYSFTGLTAGNYVVRVADVNFAIGQPLANYRVSSQPFVTTDNSVDNDNNGRQPISSFAAISPVIALTAAGETTAEDSNNNTDMTVDFGFKAASSNCRILYICGDAKAQDGDAYDHGLMKYIETRYGPGVLYPVFCKTSGSILGLYDVNNKSSELSLTLTNYQSIIVSGTCYYLTMPALETALRDTSVPVLIMTGSTAKGAKLISAETLHWGEWAYDTADRQFYLLNTTNPNSIYDPLFEAGTPYTGYTGYVWGNAASKAANNNAIFFTYNAGGLTAQGAAAGHGKRAFLGYHQNSVQENPTNSRLPVPESEWLDLTTDITATAKAYLDQALDFAGPVCTDFGDYTSFASASQVVSSAIRIGTAATDIESASPANATATGDDAAGGTPDDEDLTMPGFVVGTATNLSVPVTLNTASLSGSTARVNVFVDWNNDGLVTGTNETLAVQTASTNGSSTLTFSLTPPTGTTAGTKYLRIRVAEGATHPGFSGTSALKGEVEDYAVTVTASATPVDYGDWNGSGAATTTTSSTVNSNLRIGASVDSETTVTANAAATTDDTTGSDDENGVWFTPSVTVGSYAQLSVKATNNTGSPAYLHAWIDFNNDGTFGAGEQVATNHLVPNGSNGYDPAGLNPGNSYYQYFRLQYLVPATASVGTGRGVRVRLTNVTNTTATGASGSGEVEDYTVSFTATAPCYRFRFGDANADKWIDPNAEMTPAANNSPIYWDQNNDLGTLREVDMTYSPVSKLFNFDCTIAQINTTGVIADSIWFMLDTGPLGMPNVQRYAMVYIDGFNRANPKVTIYVENATSHSGSWSNPGFLLLSTDASGPVNASDVKVLSVTEDTVAKTSRFRLTLDTTRINDRTIWPAGYNMDADWRGIEMRSTAGLWLTVSDHTSAPTYAAGKIAAMNYNSSGSTVNIDVPPMGDLPIFTQACTLDFGDHFFGIANSASQLASVDAKIGTAATDAEGDYADSGASLDDTSGTDDEDLVLPGVTLDTTTNITVPVTLVSPVTAARVIVFVDWNGDADASDPSETLLVQSVTSTGNRTFALTPPAGTTAGTKYLRVRLSEGSTTPLFTGASLSAGEVEDYAVTVNACPTVNSLTLADGTWNAAYTQATAFSATGGTGTLTWTASGLPAGMSFDAVNRKITGAPSQVGRFRVIVNATDTNGCVGTRTFAFNVLGCGTTQWVYTWDRGYDALDGDDPGGIWQRMSMVQNQTAGTLDVSATLDVSTNSTQALWMSVTNGPTPSTTDANYAAMYLVNGTVYVTPYSQNPTVTHVMPTTITTTTYTNTLVGSKRTFAFQLNTNTINTWAGGGSTWKGVGFPLDAQGSVWGSSTTPYRMGAWARAFADGAATFSGGTWNVTWGTPPDNNIGSWDGVMDFLMSCCGLTVNPASINNGTLGIAYTQGTAFTATGGMPAYTWTVVSGLPPGLSLNTTTRMLTGTPTTAGTYSVVIRATDGYGCTGQKTYTVVISAPSSDYGDYSGFGGATQTANSAIRIGTALTDAESASPANATAAGDDTVGTDDEDLTMPIFTVGTATTLAVPMTITAASLSGSTARVNVFVDWNGDNDVADANETLAAQTVSATGTFNFSLTPPAGTTLGTKFLRIRAAEGATHPGFSGVSSLKGEVEDYPIAVGYDFGDAPSPYPSASAPGANPAIGLGPTIDFEATQAADDGADEDGFFAVNQIVPGKEFHFNIHQKVLAGNSYVNVWIDWNRDGDFADAGEQVVTNRLSTANSFGTDAGASFNTIVVPTTASVGASWVRVRINSTTGASHSGATNDGEVEDHPVTIQDAVNLGGVVWLDANNNGQYLSPEVLLPGVPVRLLDAASNVIETTLTNASGAYTFIVPPGSYIIHVANPLSASLTPAIKDSGADATDSDFDTTTGRTGTITLASGAADQVDWDAGFVPALGVQCVGASTTLSTTNISTTLNVPKFNTANGTLTAVSILRTSAERRGYWFQNHGPSTSTVTYTNELTRTYTLPNASTVSNAVSTDTQSDSLAGVTAATALLGTGTTGYSRPLRFATNTTSGNYAGPLTDFSGASGTSAIGVSVVADGTMNTTGGNSSQQIRTQSQDGVIVCYTYTPQDVGDYSSFAGATQVANSAIQIGTNPTDAEATTVTDATALADDILDYDDEDLTMPSFIVGSASTLAVPMTIVPASLSGSTARVNVFVDWNGDGLVTGTNETLVAQTVSATGTFSFSLTPPTGTAAGTKYLRIRAAEGATHPGFSGTSTLKGEVEDYAITVTAITTDFGDWNGAGAATATASSTMNSNLRLGALVDAEASITANATATTDDTTGSDDEDGVTMPASISQGQSVTIPVLVQNTTGAVAYLHSWIDFNNDGTFNDTVVSSGGERLEPVRTINNGTTTSTAQNITFSVPAAASAGTQRGVRFRLTNSNATTPINAGATGEIEDYVVTISAGSLSLGNLLFYDNNNNAIYDTGDTGVPGAVVQLYNSSNALVTSTTTLNTTTTVPTLALEQAHSSVWIDNITSALACLSGTNRSAYWTGNGSIINYLVPGDTDGRFTTGNAAFPTGSSQGYVIRATGNITIPTAGAYTFGMTLDDAGRLRIDGANVILDDSGFHAVADRFGTVTLTAGTHTIEMIYLGAWGGSVELYAQAGTHGTWNTGFKLVGDTANGGLAVSSSGTVGPDTGKYSFTGLAAGSYYVKVPASEFGVGKPLFRKESTVTTTVTPTDDNRDDNSTTGSGDDGIDVADPTADGIRSPLIALALGAEPTGAGTETGFYKTDDDALDTNGNLTVDFGFRPSTTGCYHFALRDDNGDSWFESTTPPQSIGFVYDGSRVAYQKLMDVTFNTGTKRFTYDNTFVQQPGKRLDGFYMVLTTGPEPTNNTQAAIMYVDLFNRNSPKATMYVYDYTLQNNTYGVDANISYTNGKLLASSQTANSPILITATESGSTLQVHISADMTGVNNFANPAYSTYGLTSAWEGFRFGNTAGIWSHYYDLPSAPVYNASFQLTSWPQDSNAANFSYLDTHNVEPIITENICEEKVGVGNVVFKDANGDGNYDAGEGVDNVLVYLYKQGHTAGVDMPEAAMLTYGGGKFFFSAFSQGNYFLHIPASEFGAGKPLVGTMSITGTGASDDHVDEDGTDVINPTVSGVSAAVFALTANTEPTDADTEAGFDKTIDNTDDNNTDLTVDLGFRTTTSAGIGNMVFIDVNGNGRYDAGDSGAGGVKVELVNNSTSAVVATTTTDSSATAQAGFSLIQMNTGATVVSSYATANTQLAGANASNSTSVIASQLNYLQTGYAEKGHFASGNIDFPITGLSNMVVRATGVINIPTAGTWTFGMNLDDGGRLRIDGADVIIDDALHTAEDRFGSVSLTAGTHTIEVTFWGYVADHSLEVFATQGSFSAWTSSFRLIGDTVSGGLAVTNTSPVNTTGRYFFPGVPAGTYVVRIPASEFGAGKPLLGYASFINGSPTDDQKDDNSTTGSSDNGIDVATPASTGISSAPITLTVGSEPTTAGGETGFMSTEDDSFDANYDLTVDFAMVPVTADYGDYSSFGSASQIAHAAIRIGINTSAATDSEASNPANAAATGDDTLGTDDEDLTMPTFTAGAATTLTVPITVPVLANISGSVGRVGVWVDWNGDGLVTGTNETITAQSVNSAGTTNLSFSLTPPIGTTAGTKYLRIRATEGSTVPAFTGASGLKGEIEDYPVTVNVPVYTTDFGDHTGFPSASQEIDVAIRIGTNATDGEVANPTTGTANADDTTGTDDEDITLPTITPGASVTLSFPVTLSGTIPNASVGAWVDWNADGDVNDSGEVLTLSTSGVSTGTTTVTTTLNPPEKSTVTGYLRLRIVEGKTAPEFSGASALKGEVEDYVLGGSCPTITLNPATLPAATLNNAYTTTLTASGGTGPYDFAVSLGSLPPDVKLNPATGEIFGTPSAAGTYNFTIMAVDSNRCTGTRAYSIVVTAATTEYGDLPDTAVGTATGNYNTLSTDSGPTHTVDSLIRLGLTVDGELNGQPNAFATGDGADEDGVSTWPNFQRGSTVTLPVSVFHNGAPASVNLRCFIDWNNDGDFLDTSETITAVTVNKSASQQTINLSIPVPAAAVLECVGLRLRLSANTTLTATGPGDVGEVEDYFITVLNSGSLMDFGDHVFGSLANSASNVASNVIRIGATVPDAEAADPSTAASNADDLTGNDEDYDDFGSVSVGSIYTSGVTVTTCSAMATASLGVWVDWNGDGDVADANEIVTLVNNMGPGTSNPVFVFSPPVGTIPGTKYVRVRVQEGSTLPSFSGTSTLKGEVEDGFITVTVPTQDYGDCEALASAWATVNSGLRLGATTPDAEGSGTTNATATADDTSGTDDEDGVTVLTAYASGMSSQVTITVTNTSGANAFLSGWIDFNNTPGTVEANEIIINNVTIATGGTNTVQTYNFTVPAGILTTRDVCARFRLSSTSGTGISGTGGNGEVEDYVVKICPAQPCAPTTSVKN